MTAAALLAVLILGATGVLIGSCIRMGWRETREIIAFGGLLVAATLGVGIAALVGGGDSDLEPVPAATTIVVESPTNGWERATAIGTIAAALAAVLAVAAALYVAQRERTAAAIRAEQDRAGLAAQVAAQQRLDLLLRYGVAMERTFAGESAALAETHAYLTALPPDALNAARVHFGRGEPNGPVQAFNVRHDPQDTLRKELHYAIRRAESALRDSRPVDPPRPTKTVTIRLPRRPP